jgi:hypothetical protein
MQIGVEGIENLLHFIVYNYVVEKKTFEKKYIWKKKTFIFHLQ